MNMMCVKCGKKATKGSMKHPYCNSCFTVFFDDNYDKYEKILVQHSGYDDKFLNTLSLWFLVVLVIITVLVVLGIIYFVKWLL